MHDTTIRVVSSNERGDWNPLVDLYDELHNRLLPQSVRDELTVQAAQAAGVTMYFTGTRHFAH